MTEAISKKQIIINTAADLFKEKGYNATSIRDLATKVGLEPSSIYSHIRSKEELLSEICMSCANKFNEGMLFIYQKDLSPKKKLKELIHLHLDMAFEMPASVTVFNDEWRYLKDPVYTEFLNVRREYEKKFKKILMEGKKSDKFVFQNIDIVFNIIIGMLNWSYSVTKKFNKEELEVELTTFIVKILNK